MTSGAQEIPIPQQSLTDIAANLQSIAYQLSAMKNDQASTKETIQEIKVMDERMAKQMTDTIFYNGSVEVTLNNLMYKHDEENNRYTFYLNDTDYTAWSDAFIELFDGHPQGSFKELLTRFENIRYTQAGSLMSLVGSTYPHVAYSKLDNGDYVDATINDAQYLSIEILHINEGAIAHMTSKPPNYSQCVVLSFVLAKNGENTWKEAETSGLSYIKEFGGTDYDCLIKKGNPEGAKPITNALSTMCSSWCAGIGDEDSDVKLKYTSSLK